MSGSGTRTTPLAPAPDPWLAHVQRLERVARLAEKAVDTFVRSGRVVTPAVREELLALEAVVRPCELGRAA